MEQLIDLFISIGSVTALTAVLAILMVIADATLGNYGEAKININNKKGYNLTSLVTIAPCPNPSSTPISIR